MLRTAAVLLCALLLGACQTTAQRGPDSPWYPPPVGSTLTLKVPLTIPPEQVSLYFQDGKLLRGSGRDQFRPWCKFEHRLRVPEPIEVLPDTFTVTRVERRIDQVLGMPAPAPAFRRVFLHLEDDSPSHLTYATRLYLSSPRQPDVLRLTCGHWEDGTPSSRHLTLNEMRAALGESFSLETP